MAKTNNDPNIERFHQSVKDRGYEHLKSTPAEAAAKNDAELTAVLVAEGLALLKAEEEAKSGPTTPKAEPVPTTTSKNPYVQARERVLKGMTDERRERIESMEANGKTDNPFYTEFTKAVMTLGDKLSDKKP